MCCGYALERYTGVVFYSAYLCQDASVLGSENFNIGCTSYKFSPKYQVTKCKSLSKVGELITLE